VQILTREHLEHCFVADDDEIISWRILLQLPQTQLSMA